MKAIGADGATSAADGGAGAGGWILGDLGLDVGFDWGAVQTAEGMECQF